MPAGLETFADGTTAYLEANKLGHVLAWHELGQAVPLGTTIHEALTLSKLDNWNVRKVPLTFTDLTDDGVTSGDVPDFYATVRTNPVTGATDYLSCVGRVFKVFQNEQQADLIQQIIGESHGHVETMGSLDSGRRVFITIKLPGTVQVGGADPVNMYLLVVNSHKHGAIKVILTYVRVVCANTLAMALRSKVNSFSIRHSTGGVTDKHVEDIRKGLQLTGNFADEIQLELDRMISASMTEAGFMKVVDKLWTPLNEDMTERKYNATQRRNLILVQKFTGLTDDQAGIAKTRWGAYNAITAWCDHETPTSKKGNAATEARALRAMTRPMETLKQRAFNLLSVS